MFIVSSEKNMEAAIVGKIIFVWSPIFWSRIHIVFSVNIAFKIFRIFKIFKNSDN